MPLNEGHEETIFSFSEKPPRLRERRRGTRVMTILRVGVLIRPQGRELCLVRNISAGGLMAHVYSSHLSGEQIAVELGLNQQIAGRTMWVDEANIGIEFDAPIDVEEMLVSNPLLENGWRQRMPRVEVDRLATVRVGARLYGVNTCDISQGGVKVETDEALTAGDEVVICMEKFRPLPGQVRWSRDGLAGIAFNEVIPFHELMRWLRPDLGEAGR